MYNVCLAVDHLVTGILKVLDLCSITCTISVMDKVDVGQQIKTDTTSTEICCRFQTWNMRTEPNARAFMCVRVCVVAQYECACCIVNHYPLFVCGSECTGVIRIQLTDRVVCSKREKRHSSSVSAIYGERFIFRSNQEKVAFYTQDCVSNRNKFEVVL